MWSCLIRLKLRPPCIGKENIMISLAADLPEATERDIWVLDQMDVIYDGTCRDH